jgi:protein SCO1/2
MTASRTGIRHPALLGLAALVTASGCGPASDLDRVAEDLTAVRSASPFTVPSHVLTDQTGAEIDLRELVRDRFAFLFFGYTHCPDVCPISMSLANAAVAQLDPAQREQVEIVFVTVDPRRDSTERIAEWLDALRTDAVGLRGSKAKIEELLSAMGFVVAPSTSIVTLPTSEDGAENYLVPHPASLFLITPDGLGHFQYPFDRGSSTEMAADLRRLMALDWSEPGAAGGAESTLPRVDDVRVAESVNGRTMAVYARIENPGESDALVAIRPGIEAAGSLHEMAGEGGMSAMRAIERIDVDRGATLELRPGGLHGMLEDMDPVPAVGDTVSLTFVFASGREVSVSAPVLPLVEIAGGMGSHTR